MPRFFGGWVGWNAACLCLQLDMVGSCYVTLPMKSKRRGASRGFVRTHTLAMSHCCRFMLCHIVVGSCYHISWAYYWFILCRIFWGYYGMVFPSGRHRCPVLTMAWCSLQAWTSSMPCTQMRHGKHKLQIKMVQRLDSRCVLAIRSQHKRCWGSQPKHVSKPDSVIKNFKSPFNV